MNNHDGAYRLLELANEENKDLKRKLQKAKESLQIVYKAFQSWPIDDYNEIEQALFCLTNGELE